MTIGLRRTLAGTALLLVPVIGQSGDTDRATDTLGAEMAALQSSVLDIGRDLLALEQDTLFPGNSQLSVYLGLSPGATAELTSLRLELDGSLAVLYHYSGRDLQALSQGGMQRLYQGNVGTGEHTLIAIVEGRDGTGKSFKERVTLPVRKQRDRARVDLSLSSKDRQGLLVSGRQHD